MPESKEEESIRKLAEGFFKSLKCKLTWKEKALLVENIPEEFEKDYGKNGPYLLVFNRDDYDKNENSELIARGSVLLKIITNYLDERGQKTLLKLEFNLDLKDLILKKIDFNRYNLKGISDKKNYEYFLRFIFLSNFQYLNEREQVSSTIYVRDRKIIDFDIDSYKVVEGKKEELNVKDIREEYNLAREKLKEGINEKTKEIVEKLNFSLESAINRIKSHYLHQVSEIDSEIKRNEEIIASLGERIKKGLEKNGDSVEKIKKLEANVERMKYSEEKYRIEKEKEMYIKDERSKHSLNLNNKLINTSIIYYPVYDIDVSLLNKTKHTKHLNLTFNPIDNALSEIHCENCNEKVDKVNLCNSNHIYCYGCGGKCVCGSDICEKCEKLSCNVCGRLVCLKCGAICSLCNKYACSSDMCKDSLTAKHICNSCAKYCSICNKFSNKKTFSKCPICSNDVCLRCSKLDFKLKKRVCVNCFKPVEFRI
jgi:hypothetical protein